MLKALVIQFSKIFLTLGTRIHFYMFIGLVKQFLLKTEDVMSICENDKWDSDHNWLEFEFFANV